jgi:tRNA and rRNA cytosine-C5-methylases
MEFQNRRDAWRVI